MRNVLKWSDILCCKIFKVSLTIFGHYALKGLKLSEELRDDHQDCPLSLERIQVT